MSARQAFIPRPPSRVTSSDTHQHSADVREADGDRNMFVNGNGKARSVTAFLGQKRGTGIDSGVQGAPPNQGPGLGRTNTNTRRQNFEGILRPELTPISIISYPTTAQQPGVGQTPRKTAAQGAFEFPKPMTPVSIPRGPKKGFGIFTEDRDETTNPNGNAHGSDNVFMGSGGEAGMSISVGTEMDGYMRVFEGSGDGRSASLEHGIAAPVPGRALGGLGVDMGDLGCRADGIFAHSGRSLDAMSETEVGMERSNNSQRSFGGTKRGTQPEDVEEHGWYPDDGHHGSAKRMKQVQHDLDEYLPISSPHIPPTPVLPSSSVNALDPSLIVGSLFEGIEDHVSLEEIAADWKRWRECSTEEWLKGADKLAQDYTDILNMVKDHLAEKVVAYANMVSSVEKRRAEVDHNIEVIHEKGNIVRENISQLGKKK